MTYWIHMTTAKLTTRKASFDVENAKELPNNVTSVTPNLAGTECVVKVVGKYDIALLTGDIIRVYDETDHHECLQMMYGPEWMDSKDWWDEATGTGGG